VSTARSMRRTRAVVFISLPGPAEFEAATLEPQTGILAGLQPGVARIDLTANAPMAIARVGEAYRSHRLSCAQLDYDRRRPWRHRRPRLRTLMLRTSVR
jgi:hypothetical protein